MKNSKECHSMLNERIESEKNLGTYLKSKVAWKFERIYLDQNNFVKN